MRNIYKPTKRDKALIVIQALWNFKTKQDAEYALALGKNMAIARNYRHMLREDMESLDGAYDTACKVVRGRL